MGFVFAIKIRIVIKNAVVYESGVVLKDRIGIKFPIVGLRVYGRERFFLVGFARANVRLL